MQIQYVSSRPLWPFFPFYGKVCKDTPWKASTKHLLKSRPPHFQEAFPLSLSLSHLSLHPQSIALLCSHIRIIQTGEVVLYKKSGLSIHVNPRTRENTHGPSLSGLHSTYGMPQKNKTNISPTKKQMKQDAFQTEHKAKWDWKCKSKNNYKSQKRYKIICLKVLFADHYLFPFFKMLLSTVK